MIPPPLWGREGRGGGGRGTDIDGCARLRTRGTSPPPHLPTRGKGISQTRSLVVPGLRRLLRIPPPHGEKSRRGVFRQLGRMTETVPACGAGLAVGPLRHDVVVPEKHAVERVCGGDEVLAAL